MDSGASTLPATPVLTKEVRSGSLERELVHQVAQQVARHPPGLWDRTVQQELVKRIALPQDWLKVLKNSAAVAVGWIDVVSCPSDDKRVILPPREGAPLIHYCCCCPDGRRKWDEGRRGSRRPVLTKSPADQGTRDPRHRTSRPTSLTHTTQRHTPTHTA